jgi:hypothetical protein
MVPPPDHPRPLGALEELVSSWIDERLRRVLDEKLRELIPREAAAPAELKGVEEPEYLSRQEADRPTGYSVKTITRWIRSHKVQAFGMRGERVRRSDVERLMAELPSQAHGGAGMIETEEAVARRILDGGRNHRGNR